MLIKNSVKYIFAYLGRLIDKKNLAESGFDPPTFEL